MTTHTELVTNGGGRHDAVTITASWDAARNWMEGAKRMEQGKLFCQVMLGFTLQALHRQSLCYQ